MQYFSNLKYLLGSGSPSFCPTFNEITYGELTGTSELALGFGVGFCFFFSICGELLGVALIARGIGRGESRGCLKAPITGGRGRLVD